MEGLAIAHGKFGYSSATNFSARRFEYVYVLGCGSNNLKHVQAYILNIIKFNKKFGILEFFLQFSSYKNRKVFF